MFVNKILAFLYVIQVNVFLIHLYLFFLYPIKSYLSLLYFKFISKDWKLSDFLIAFFDLIHYEQHHGFLIIEVSPSFDSLRKVP